MRSAWPPYFLVPHYHDIDWRYICFFYLAGEQSLVDLCQLAPMNFCVHGVSGANLLCMYGLANGHAFGRPSAPALKSRICIVREDGSGWR